MSLVYSSVPQLPPAADAHAAAHADSHHDATMERGVSSIRRLRIACALLLVMVVAQALERHFNSAGGAVFWANFTWTRTSILRPLSDLPAAPQGCSSEVEVERSLSSSPPALLDCLGVHRLQLVTAQWALPSQLPSHADTSFSGVGDVRLFLRPQLTERYAAPESRRTHTIDIHGVAERSALQAQIDANYSSIRADIAQAQIESREWRRASLRAGAGAGARANSPTGDRSHDRDRQVIEEMLVAPARVLRCCQLLPLLPPVPAAEPAAAAASSRVSQLDASRLSFLRDQWVLLVGDSTDRYQVTVLCLPHLGGIHDTHSIPGHTLCHLPQLNFTLVNVHLDGVMESGWFHTEGVSLIVKLSGALQQLHDRFRRPPVAISMQSLLWDVAGFGEMIWQSHHGHNISHAYTHPFTAPVHPTMPYLQRLEHYLLRPLARVFNVRSVLRRSALTTPPSAMLLADDPAWMRWGRAHPGRCFWPAPLDMDATPAQCPIASDQQQHVVAKTREQEENGIAALRMLITNTPRFRRGDGDGHGHGHGHGHGSDPLLLLRSQSYCKLRLSVRAASIHSLNAASSLLANAYSLPFADLGVPPVAFAAVRRTHSNAWARARQQRQTRTGWHARGSAIHKLVVRITNPDPLPLSLSLSLLLSPCGTGLFFECFVVFVIFFCFFCRTCATFASV